MKFIEKIEGADTIAIGGHVRPDGDRVWDFLGILRTIIRKRKSVCIWRKFRRHLII